jgi:hypothetical protein
MPKQEARIAAIEAMPLRCRNCNGCRSLALSIATVVAMRETILTPGQKRNISEYIDYCEEGSGRQLSCSFHENACNHPVLSTMNSKETDELAEELLLEDG